MRYNYYYCQSYDPKLISLLEINHIRYRVTGGAITPRIISFSIWDSFADAENIRKEIAETWGTEPIVTAEYTATELAAAKLIWVTPVKQCIDITNEQEAYLSACKRIDFLGNIRVKHREQRKLFSVAKEPSMNTRTAFWAESTGFAEIFADRRIYELCNEKSLTGIEFKHVILKKGGSSENLY